MGTRSLTIVYDSFDDKALVCMYRQMDGYPTGHGAELAEFLNSFDAIVNGYAFNETRKVANGMGCLAAQMIAHFKVGVGNFYLYPIGSSDVGEEYVYHVRENNVIVCDYGNNKIFNGTWVEFAEWCKKDPE